jgi:hypothetical protein
VREMDAYASVGFETLKFPVIANKFADRLNIFPVNLSRELFKKWLQHRGFLLRNRLSVPQNRQNSL